MSSYLATYIKFNRFQAYLICHPLRTRSNSGVLDQSTLRQNWGFKSWRGGPIVIIIATPCYYCDTDPVVAISTRIPRLIGDVSAMKQSRIASTSRPRIVSWSCRSKRRNKQAMVIYSSARARLERSRHSISSSKLDEVTICRKDSLQTNTHAAATAEGHICLIDPFDIGVFRKPSSGAELQRAVKYCGV